MFTLDFLCPGHPFVAHCFCVLPNLSLKDKPSKLFHLVLSHALFSSTCTLLHFMILSLHKATFLRGIIVGRTCSARFIINSVFVNDLSNFKYLAS
jgi:hypothetical protein